MVRPPLKGCAAAAAAAGVGFLLLGAFVVTFCTVCMAAVVPSPVNPHGDVSGSVVGLPLAFLAGYVVVTVVFLILRRWGWR